MLEPSRPLHSIKICDSCYFSIFSRNINFLFQPYFQRYCTYQLFYVISHTQLPEKTCSGADFHIRSRAASVCDWTSGILLTKPILYCTVLNSILSACSFKCNLEWELTSFENVLKTQTSCIVGLKQKIYISRKYRKIATITNFNTVEGSRRLQHMGM